MLRSLASLFSSPLCQQSVASNSLLVRLPWSHLLCSNPIHVSSSNAVFRGPYLVHRKKRRTTYPFHWWANAMKGTSFKTNLTSQNQQFIDDVVKERFSLEPGKSPLKFEQMERGEYVPGSARTGVIARKIGQMPMWTTSGRRLLTTALQIVDNHVVSYTNNADWIQERRSFYNKHPYKDRDVLIVGAESADPREYPLTYLGLFNKACIPPKKRLARFFITPNAKLAPGTPLTAGHFRAGDYVDVWGKTKDHGFQGVIRRWHFKGQLQHRGVTKAHRRPGSIGRGRKLCGPLRGTKMPGHMGCERRVMKGLKIWRVNTKYNIIWVHGPAVPGVTNSWVYIYDSNVEEKRYPSDSPPPFPTYYEDEAQQPLPENMYDKELHAFDAPSLLFEETEEEKKAALAALKMSKKAKIAKIR